jgi:hypothetical protein
VGYFKNFKENAYEASVEVYYKQINNIVEYKEGARLLLNPSIETDLLNAKGYAYGIEFLLKKTYGRLSGWLSYTYSRSLRQTIDAETSELINRGEVFPSNFDKPHDLSLTSAYQISRRWKLSWNFTYSTGRPVTLPESKYSYLNMQMVGFSDRNKYRMPDYHRLDLSLTYGGSIKKTRKWKSSWTLSLYNAYGRNNTYSVYYTSDTPSEVNNFNQYVLYKLSVVDRPIPTLTYNFTF